MKRLWSLSMVIIFWRWLPRRGRPGAPPLYHQVAGGEEDASTRETPLNHPGRGKGGKGYGGDPAEPHKKP